MRLKIESDRGRRVPRAEGEQLLEGFEEVRFVHQKRNDGEGSGEFEGVLRGVREEQKQKLCRWNGYVPDEVYCEKCVRSD